MPFNAIAREAGVGQGVLYRHFPTRLDVALAVFSQNIEALERAAQEHTGNDAFGIMLAQLLGTVMESAAFVDVVVHVRDRPEFDGIQTITTLLAGPLARAQEAGLVRGDVTVADLVLLVRMAYGVVVTRPDPEAARSAVLRAVELVDADLGRTVAERWAPGGSAATG